MLHSLHPESAGRTGFTLIEMMVAASLSLIVIGGVTLSATAMARSYLVTRDLVETQHNLRVAQEMVFRDLRTAGYGLHEIADPLSDWVPGFTNTVMVTQGASASDPDRLRILGAEAVPGGELVFAEAAGSTVLTLKPGGAGHFNTTTRNLVTVGRLETAQVVGVGTNTITISTDPVSTGSGLQYAHPADSPVELITVTTYECMTTNLTQTGGQPYLARYQNAASAPTSALLALAAIGIDQFQVTEGTNGTFRVDLTGRASRPDGTYSHPVVGDHYRRYTIASELQSIN